MWLVITVIQKLAQHETCIFFVLLLFKTSYNPYSKLYIWIIHIVCQKGNNSIDLLEQFDEFPPYLLQGQLF